MNEAVEDLPIGWEWAKLSAVTELVPNVKPNEKPEKDFAYVDISSICNQTNRISCTKTLKGKDAPSRARRPIRTGDVLFSNVRTYLRNIALLTDDTPAQVCSTGFTVLRSNGAVDPTLLFRFVLTDDFIRQTEETQTGTHYPATSDRAVLGLSMPVPPLAEQKRIVAKVEAVLGRVTAARQRLAKVPAILKRFRQAVLAAACSGRLTEDWRDEQVNERAEQCDNPDSVPDSWERVLFEEVCEDITVGHVGPMAKEYVESGIPFLRSQNVREFRFDPAGLKFISANFHQRLKKSALKPGDVTIVRSGNAGVTCVIPQTLPEANCADLVIVRPGNRLHSYFAAIFLNSSTAKTHVEAEKVGIAQGHFNVGSMRTTPLPLPPLPEQHEIVRRVDALFKLADAIERRVAAASARADKLTQAVLAKAFRGELVPTEAELARAEGRDYEPAAKLLERVRAERSGATAN